MRGFHHLLILLVLLPFYVRAQTDTVHRSRLNDTMQIGEIIVKARTAVKINGDTVNYTVDSFYKNPLSTAEDVLKRLPGVEVDMNGKVTIQGKEAVKLFINGKEYMVDDLRTITQNLPAEILDKIEVADWYDEDAQFSGIRKGTDQKYINLKLKKQYLSGVYGRAVAGYGTQERYQAGAFATYMNPGLKLTAIANINNTGIADATSDAQQNNASATGAGSQGVVEKKLGNINFSYDTAKSKWKFNGNYDVSRSGTTLQQQLLRTTYLPGDTLLLRDQHVNQFNTAMQHSLSLKATYNPNKRTNFFSELRLSYRNVSTGNTSQDRTSYNNDTLPNFMRNAITDGHTSAANVQLTNTLQQKFTKKGRTLSATLALKYAGDSKEGTNNNENRYYFPPLYNTTSFLTTDIRRDVNARLSLQYTEPLDAHSNVLLKYGNNYAPSFDNRDVTNAYTHKEDSVQSRYYNATSLETPFGITYQYQAGDITINGGVDAQAYNRSSLTEQLVNTKLEQKGINYFPNVFFKYLFSPKSNISFNYNGRVTAPDIKQLQPAPDYTDSLNIYIGNPSLKPQLDNSLSLNYNYNNINTQRMFWATASGSFPYHNIINSVDIQASRRITAPVNRDGNYNFSGSLNYTFPLLNKKVKATVNVRAGKSKNVSITNGTLLSTINNSITPGVKMVLLHTDWYEGDLGYSYRANKVVNSATISQPILQVHTVTGGGTFFIPGNIKLGYYLNYVVNRGLTGNFQKNFFLFNMNIDKSFLHPKGLSVRLQAYDVLNKYPTTQRIVGDNYYEDRSVNRIGSYYMLSVIYRFARF